MMFAIGNDRGQLQHFDISLTCIRSQTLNEDTTPTNILDLSSYFRSQPALICMEWNKKSDSGTCTDYYCHGEALFLLLFERGPMGVIKMIEGNDLPGDVLIKRYLSLSQVEQATSLLLSMNWDTHPRICMHSLNQILNYLFKLPLTTERENLIQNALGSFHVPVSPISQAIEEEYGDEVRDLTRRFFHHLLRYRMFEKAFRLAIDLNDHDLFMDIHFYAVVLNDTEMANAAKEKAEHILSRSNSCTSSHSRCSRESCSICSDSASDKGEESYSEESQDSTKEDECSPKQLEKHSYGRSPSQIPPLPVLHSQRGGKLLYDGSLPISKADNLMSTSFNTASTAFTTTTFNHSHTSTSNSFFASTTFGKSPYKTQMTPLIPIIGTSDSRACDNISEDMMTTSFGSQNLESDLTNKLESRDHLPTNFKSFTNEVQCSFSNTTDMVGIAPSEDHSIMSTPFNNSVYESVSVDGSSIRLTSSLASTDNMISTSFSTPVLSFQASCNKSTSSVTLDNKCDVSSSDLRSVTSCDLINTPTSETFSDALANKLASTVLESRRNLISTPFNSSEGHLISDIASEEVKTFEDESECMPKRQAGFGKKQVDFEVPPPPSLTNSFVNYLHNLPRKNSLLSRSTPGLVNLDEPMKKYSLPKSTNNTTRLLERQNSVSNILQSQRKYINPLPTKSYRLSYDLDYIPFHGSCDNVDIMQHSSSHNVKFSSVGTLHHLHPNYNMQNRHSRLIGSSQSSISVSINKETKMSSNVPPLPVINVSVSNSKTCSPCTTYVETPATHNEKPKVKFSDTVTHILVPGTGQVHKQKRPLSAQTHITDPKRELAESLPLCLGNEDYLKDFQPLSKDCDDKTKELPKTDESAKIKVVHFGLL